MDSLMQEENTCEMAIDINTLWSLYHHHLDSSRQEQPFAAAERDESQ